MLVVQGFLHFTTHSFFSFYLHKFLFFFFYFSLLAFFIIFSCSSQFLLSFFLILCFIIFNFFIFSLIYFHIQQFCFLAPRFWEKKWTISPSNASNLTYEFCMRILSIFSSKTRWWETKVLKNVEIFAVCQVV